MMYNFVGPVIDKVLGLRCTSFGYKDGKALSAEHLHAQQIRPKMLIRKQKCKIL